MMELKKNQILEAEIEAYSSEAVGICRVDGRAVFVPNTLKGERCRVRILKVGSAAIYGKMEELLGASPERRQPDCPVYGRCGGCDCRHMSYEEELRFKLGRVNDALRHIGKQSVFAEEIVGSEETDCYRNKGIYAVGEVEGRVSFGFYRPRSHELVPIDRCLLQTELSCRAASTVVRFMNENGVPPYDEKSGKGTVRHIFARQSIGQRGAVVCIVAARGFGALTGKLVDALREACPEITGIVLNVNKNKGNTILYGDFYTLWGEETILDSLCGIRFQISPQSFFQINPPQAEKLYRKAVSYAVQKPSDLILDLYCGAGTISLCLAQKAERVIGAEIVPEAIENARQNARRNGIDHAEFLCADAAMAARSFADRGLRPDAIVVDPPRKGMDEQAVEAVCSMRPDRIVYVSCNPATLARDILRFQEKEYQLEKVTAVDMFPRTCHVETVCCLYHQKKDYISVPYEPKDAEYLK